MSGIPDPEKIAAIERVKQDPHGETEMQGIWKLLWRVGRHRDRHIYAQLGHKPADDDPYLATFDSGRMAQAVVDLHNLATAGYRGGR